MNPFLYGLVGGLEHLDYFPFHIWDVLPIDELHHFSKWLKPPTSNYDIILYPVNPNNPPFNHH